MWTCSSTVLSDPRIRVKKPSVNFALRVAVLAIWGSGRPAWAGGMLDEGRRSSGVTSSRDPPLGPD